MMETLAQVIAQADARGQYLSSTQLEAVMSSTQLEAFKEMIASSNKRMDAINRISKNAPMIVVDTVRAWSIEHTELVSASDNNYPAQQFGDCLCDLDTILRYITYATFSGAIDVLEDSSLTELRERYSVPGSFSISIASAVQVMKYLAIDVVSDPSGITPGDCSSIITELASYFDYVIKSLGEVNFNTSASLAIQKLKKLRDEVNGTDFTNVNANASWEPSNYTEWVEKDKLTQTLSKYEVEDPLLFEESALRFFQSWKQLSSQEKKEVWREREIMASLYEQMMQYWKTIPGFRSVAVADRVVNAKKQLTGILVFNFAVDNDYYKIWNIPLNLKVESTIPLLSQELIPIQLEWMPKNTEFSKEITAPSSIDISLPKLFSVQSGDMIAGCNATNRLNKASTVTLTTFVTPRNSSDASDIRLLTVGHGFKGGYTDIHTCEFTPSTKIGEISYESPIQEEHAEKIDVSLIKPIDALQINPCIKGTDLSPKPPIQVTKRGMRVQMYGGSSKHQIGYIDYSEILDYGPISSVIPNFTAKISAEPGDSGALLITGHGTSGDPEPDGKERGYSEEYLNSRRFAMLGLLIEGTIRGAFQDVVIFRPIDTVFLYLKVNPYLRAL